DYLLWRFIAVGFERRQHHSPAAVWHDRALQRRIRLKSHNDFIVLVDVTRRVRDDGAWDQRNVEYAFLAFFDEQVFQFFPDPLGTFRRGREERTVAFIRRVVVLKEPA